MRSNDAEPNGFVYIVGAGPGDPDLITVKGLRALRNSDVVLHDRLIPADLLREVRPGAVVIDVGKRAGFEHEQQSAIHAFMIDYAQQGKTVCRLKGGDPFVFGRGGEEVESLRQAGIPFEVIPGVSSAFAAPGAAGIPLTHRDHGHAFMVIAGSKSRDLSSTEWAAAAQLLAAGGSVVVMMGLARLPLLSAHLISAGCSSEVPAAVISKATWPDERIVFGELSTIAVIAGSLESPAVAVFGSVAAPTEQFGMESFWGEARTSQVRS